MASALTTKVRTIGKNVAAVYASTFASCLTTMTAMAQNGQADTSIGGFTSDGTFDGMKSTIGNIIASAYNMLQSFVVPLAAVACLCAILIMYLPGMSNKTTDKCKTVIWSCIATVVIAFALKNVFTLAQSIGSKLTMTAG